MPPVVSIVGKSESGKTTLLVKLIAELKRRGYRIMAVKHTHEDIQPDKQGKDSWRLALAGSDVTVLSSPAGTFWFKSSSREPSLQELSQMLNSDYDIVLAEGFKGEANPKIEVHRQELGPDLACPPGKLVAIVSDVPPSVDLPTYSPEDITGIASFLEENFLSPQRGQEDVTLVLNGTAVALDPFTKRMFSGIILGMVSALKDLPQVEAVRLGIRKRKG